MEQPVQGPGMPGDWFHKGDSASSTKYQIIINNGDITVDADGDGIDSNGNIFFKGGTVIVNGSTTVEMVPWTMVTVQTASVKFPVEH